MVSSDRTNSTVAKLIESEASGGVVEFDADEAALAGAFLEDAIDDNDLGEPVDSAEQEW